MIYQESMTTVKTKGGKSLKKVVKKKKLSKMQSPPILHLKTLTKILFTSKISYSQKKSL